MKLDSRSAIDSNINMAFSRAIIKSRIQKSPFIVVLATQVFVLLTLRNVLSLAHLQIAPWTFVFAQSGVSAFLCKKCFRLPHWLVTISLIMPPLFYVAFHYLPESTSLYGAAFIIMAVTFSHTLKERVPLYLTNTTTAEALKDLIEKNQSKHVVDLGSGLGGVVRAMAEKKVRSVGVESAPGPWLVSSILSLLSGKGKILRKNIWKTDLHECDLVYAFLSPAVMEELWEKIEREMRPGTLFVSNSFQVPQVKASEILQLKDARKTKLYLYRIN